MTIEALSALRASQTNPAGGISSAQSALATQAPGASGGPDFGSVLADIASTGVKTMQAGEAAALSGLQGRTSVQEVVASVMSAEQTLQAAIAIRDKVVAAYQEISRMAI